MVFEELNYSSWYLSSEEFTSSCVKEQVKTP